MFTKKEYAIISRQAKRHTLSITEYTKQATIAYSKNTIVQLDPLLVGRLREILLMVYHRLCDLHDDKKIDEKDIRLALESLACAKQDIVTELHNPKRVEVVITETILINPSYKQTLIDYLNTL